MSLIKWGENRTTKIFQEQKNISDNIPKILSNCIGYTHIK